MSTVRFSHEEIVREAKFSAEDIAEIQKRRRDNNRLGFAYQLAFVRLAHRFPGRYVIRPKNHTTREKYNENYPNFIVCEWQSSRVV